MLSQIIRHTPQDNAVTVFPGDTETVTIPLPQGISPESGDQFTLTVHESTSQASRLLLSVTSQSNTFVIPSQITGTLAPGQYSARVVLQRTVQQQTVKTTVYPQKNSVRFDSANWKNFIVLIAP